MKEERVAGRFYPGKLISHINQPKGIKWDYDELEDLIRAKIAENVEKYRNIYRKHDWRTMGGNPEDFVSKYILNDVFPSIYSKDGFANLPEGYRIVDHDTWPTVKEDVYVYYVTYQYTGCVVNGHVLKAERRILRYAEPTNKPYHVHFFKEELIKLLGV